MIKKVALIASIILPFWNIPLIVRIIKRKSSRDISMHWVVGVWTCFVLMAPQGFISEDLVFRTFSIINFIFFTIVFIIVLVYRKERPKRLEKE